MTIRNDFEQMKKEFAEVRAAIRQLRHAEIAPAVRELLDELVPAFDRAFADVETTMPKAPRRNRERLESQAGSESCRAADPGRVSAPGAEPTAPAPARGGVRPLPRRTASAT